MSDLVPSNIQVPAHLAARIGKVSDSVLSRAMVGGIGMGGPSYPRISIKGARFRLVEGDVETVLDSVVLESVIVGANPRLSKAYYSKSYTPDAETTAPNCYSLDGIRPAGDAEEPQNDVCATCQHNAWGSKITPTGQEVKACADKKRLAIVSADDVDGNIFLLEVTPAALRGLNQYHKELAARGIPAEIVKTRIGFDTDASFPKLTFKFGGFLDEGTQASVDQLFGSDRVREITGEVELNAEQPVTVVAPKSAAKPAPKPAPIVVEEEEVVEEVVEAAPPKKASGFGKATATPAPAAKPAAAKPAAAKPAAAKPAAPSTDSLADEIANMLEGLGDDD